MLQLLFEVLPPLSESECDDVTPRLEGLALSVVDFLVFLDPFAQFVDPKQGVLSVAYMLVRVVIN